jgi:dipeptidyl aminopeptidase/acylaminoacyl peptidase
MHNMKPPFLPLQVLRAGAALVLCVGLTALGPAEIQAQTSAPASSFTVDDFFQLRTPSLEALNPDGRQALVSYTSMEGRLGLNSYRFGDPTYVAPTLSELYLVDTRSGQSTRLFSQQRQLQGSAWSPAGRYLAAVVREGGMEEAMRDAPFQLLVGTPAGDGLRPVSLPRDRVLDPDTELRWSPDGTRLVFATRTAQWANEARARFDLEVNGPIVVRSSGNDFLSWEEIRRMGLDRSLAVYDLETGRVEEILPQGALGSWALTEDAAWLRLHRDITPGTDYERIFGRTDRIVAVPADRLEEEGAERVLFDSDEGLTIRWSGDDWAWAFARGDSLFFGHLELEEPRVLAVPDPGADEGRTEAEGPHGEEPATEDEEEGEDRSFSPIRLSHDGAFLIASNSEGFWLFDTATGDRELFVEQDSGDDDGPRWSVAEWSRDGERIYLTYASRTEWEWGVYRYDRQGRGMTELVRDGRRYSNLRLADDGATLLLAVAEPGRPPELFAAGPELEELRPLTASNPWLEERALGDVELMEYLDVDGEKLYGILHLPPGYDASRTYPTVFILYETFFDPNFNATAALLNAHGYVVVLPSVNLVRGYPGEGWLKGVTAAANQLVERGVADPDRLGVQGVSYGGYAVNLLVAQTPRFAAAINISGKANMVSFYTDSPRLATRNIHAPERSQDRIGATLWEQPHKYLAHSAIMMADRITTPLLLLTGQQDHNVTERTTSEMYYALRRLGREVEWVSYIDGGHGMPRSTRAEAQDYLDRILEWYQRQMGEGEGAEVADGEAGDS